MIQTSLTLTTSSSKYGTSSLKIPSGNEIWQWQYSTATFDYRRSYILFEINYRLLYIIYIFIDQLHTTIHLVLHFVRLQGFLSIGQPLACWPLRFPVETPCDECPGVITYGYIWHKVRRPVLSWFRTHERRMRTMVLAYLPTKLGIFQGKCWYMGNSSSVPLEP